LIDARGRDLDPEPFADWTAIEAYLDATAGGVLRLAVEACGQECAPIESLLRHAGRAWGCVGLVRAAPYWSARGRSVLPSEDGSAAAMLRRALAEFEQARLSAPRLPGEAFPAIGYVALVPAYARALGRERDGVALLTRQFRLIAAAAAGRL
jgi:phytoene/squalene synthetase